MYKCFLPRTAILTKRYQQVSRSILHTHFFYSSQWFTKSLKTARKVQFLIKLFWFK
uniref:Uncharacterized protein n=1 Tax=Arundo donax TaxID=35708 RepID=A0A0A9BF02_ARUDO